ncbi:MAG: metal ABC transporter ATP-binding protein [Pseudomonadota bacterium]
MIAAPEIRLEAVSVVVDRRSLLEPLDLSIAPGTWCGIVGPNGGGKSTLIKALTGLVDHHGKIALFWSQARPGRVGYMPQRVDLDTSLPITVKDYLRLHCEHRPVWLRANGNDRVDSLVEILEVVPFLNQRIGSLSMGQHQRMMLCAALANEPQLLLLDEPLAGVDEAGREILLRVLSRYNADGGSILMVEHNWEVVRSYCTQVVWIDQGLVGVGTAEGILQQLGERISPFELQAAAKPASSS